MPMPEQERLSVVVHRRVFQFVGPQMKACLLFRDIHKQWSDLFYLLASTIPHVQIDPSGQHLILRQENPSPRIRVEAHIPLSCKPFFLFDQRFLPIHRWVERFP